MGQWVVHYVFPDPQSDKGDTLCKVVQIRAQDEAQARQFAQEIAPCEEFIFSLHPASDAQILGTVRHQALKMSGKAQSGMFCEEPEDAEPPEAVGEADEHDPPNAPAVVNWNVDTKDSAAPSPASPEQAPSPKAPPPLSPQDNETIRKRQAIMDRVRKLSKKSSTG